MRVNAQMDDGAIRGTPLILAHGWPSFRLEPYQLAESHTLPFPFHFADPNFGDRIRKGTRPEELQQRIQEELRFAEERLEQVEPSMQDAIGQHRLQMVRDHRPLR